MAYLDEKNRKGETKDVEAENLDISAAEPNEDPSLRPDSPLLAMALKAQADRKAGRYVPLP